MKKNHVPSYSRLVWEQYKKNRIGMLALLFLALFAFVGLYAPFFAASKPLFIVYDDKLYFPLFRYLFHTGYYTKKIDLFYNLLMFTLPIFVSLCIFCSHAWKKCVFWIFCAIQGSVFLILASGVVKDPASDLPLTRAKQEAKKRARLSSQDPLLSSPASFRDWDFELQYLNDYAKLNLVLRHEIRLNQHNKLAPIAPLYEKQTGKPMPTLYGVDQKNRELEQKRLQELVEQNKEAYEQALQQLPTLKAHYLPHSHSLIKAKEQLKKAQQLLQAYLKMSLPKDKIQEAQKTLAQAEKALLQELENSREVRVPLEESSRAIERTLEARSKLKYLHNRQRWLDAQHEAISFILFPFLRPFHWEDDAGGQQSINKFVSWWDRSRINRKDLVAGLIFGVRISLVVGITAVALSLLIGIPTGMMSGYFAGKVDLFVFRLIEVWEAMPTFFMLLLVVAVAQSKSIFLVIAVLGIFGWTGFARFIRGEVLKQRKLPYVLASKNLGYKSSHIMFSEILPNAIPPILTLLPFSMMAAITSEAGLSFLGLGEEGSTSWGVLMDEGRSVFPGESYLLWPPAILLTLLLIAIALVGDTLRDAIDPKLQN